ncbi:MAG: class I SAM-dependent methyltransferase, partial [Anaerolineae bacterium]|nr:class I SAM-dependent methyltransferase [Anaerolineae bacterium]
DIGCGTGSLSLVLAGLGHAVVGIDLAPAMLALAQAKAEAAGHSITFHVMDAALPQLAPEQFDVIVCRHLLWALAEPDQVLERWLRLLKPGGRLLLIEGYWHTGAGLHARELLALLPAALTQATLQPLSDWAELWGGAVEDERYAILAHLSAG